MTYEVREIIEMKHVMLTLILGEKGRCGRILALLCGCYGEYKLWMEEITYSSIAIAEERDDGGGDWDHSSGDQVLYIV